MTPLHGVWGVMLIPLQLHDYGQFSGHASSYFLEFWDVGGAPYHKKGRPVFFQNVNGMYKHTYIHTWHTYVA